jgi:ABC-type transporter MlaC component
MCRNMLLAFSLLMVASVPAAAQQNTPDQVVAEMYKLCDSVSIFFDANARKRFLSKRLQAALAAMDKRTPKGEISDLDFDPVSSSQDPSVQDLKISTESADAKQAVVVADFRSHQNAERTVLRYSLTREEGGWKVDDIASQGKDAWQVSKIIAGQAQ